MNCQTVGAGFKPARPLIPINGSITATWHNALSPIATSKIWTATLYQSVMTTPPFQIVGVGLKPTSALPIGRVVCILRPSSGIVHDVCAYPGQFTHTYMAATQQLDIIPDRITVGPPIPLSRQGLSIIMPLAAFSRHVMLSLSKHLRPFGYAQGDRMGQSKDPGILSPSP